MKELPRNFILLLHGDAYVKSFPVVIIDGECYVKLFEKPVDLDGEKAKVMDGIKQRALKKLTQQEKIALGLV